MTNSSKHLRLLASPTPVLSLQQHFLTQVCMVTGDFETWPPELPTLWGIVITSLTPGVKPVWDYNQQRRNRTSYYEGSFRRSRQDQARIRTWYPCHYWVFHQSPVTSQRLKQYLSDAFQHSSVGILLDPNCLRPQGDKQGHMLLPYMIKNGFLHNRLGNKKYYL